MRRNNAKNRGIRFLLFLIAFFGFAFKFANFRFDIEGASSSKEESSSSGVEMQTENPSDSITVYETEEGNYSFEILPVEETIDITEEVLGASCEQYNNEFNVRRFCNNADMEGRVEDVSGGGNVYWSGSSGDISPEAKVEIELVEVTFPSQLANGSKVVKDNTEDITIEDPVYKSYGDTISADYADKFKSPYEVKNGDSFTAEKSQGKTAFKVFAENSISTAETILDNIVGEYVVQEQDNEKYCSFCNSNVQPSFFNPKPSNDAGEYLDNMMQIPGGDPVEEEGDVCIPRNDSMTETFTYSDGLETLCYDAVNPVATFLGNLVFSFSQEQWSDCNTVTIEELITGEKSEESAECYSAEDIVVEMSSIFGSVDECEDGVCTNAFLTRKFNSTLSPTEIEGYDEDGASSDNSLRFTILTPCTIEVSVKEGVFGVKTVHTYCMWDATPILDNYRLLQAEKVPGQEDFPQTFEQYWDLVKQAVKKHTELSL